MEFYEPYLKPDKKDPDCFKPDSVKFSRTVLKQDPNNPKSVSELILQKYELDIKP